MEITFGQNSVLSKFGEGSAEEAKISKIVCYVENQKMYDIFKNQPPVTLRRAIIDPEKQLFLVYVPLKFSYRVEIGCPCLFMLVNVHFYNLERFTFKHLCISL